MRACVLDCVDRRGFNFQVESDFDFDFSLYFKTKCESTTTVDFKLGRSTGFSLV